MVKCEIFIEEKKLRDVVHAYNLILTSLCKSAHPLDNKSCRNVRHTFSCNGLRGVNT